MKNKILICILMITSLLLLTSCKDENNIVPVFMYYLGDPYIMEFTDNIETEAIDRLEIAVYDAQNSQLLQNEMIEEVLRNDPQILIINPVDRLGAYTIIEKVKPLNIPIIFINREPLKKDMNSWDKLYYLGAPAENSAVLQSEMVIDVFGSPVNLSDMDKNNDNIIQLVILKGEIGHQDAETRSEVVVQELEDYGYQLEILSILPCEWQTAVADQKIREFLNDSEDTIELVISNNDAMAIGVVDALKEYGYFEDVNQNGVIDRDVDKWVPVIGIDGIGDVFEYIEDGYIYGTVINDSESMSIQLLELIEALLNDDVSTLSFELVDEKYIWVDYKKYEDTED